MAASNDLNFEGYLCELLKALDFRKLNVFEQEMTIQKNGHLWVTYIIYVIFIQKRIYEILWIRRKENNKFIIYVSSTITSVCPIVETFSSLIE